MATESPEPQGGGGASDRVVTVPNGISLSRLVLAGVAVALLFATKDRVLAAALLAIAGVTDFVDGYVARRFDQVSNIGKLLDPTVDRLVLAASIMAIVVYGAVPPWIAGVVLGREVFVSAAVLSLAAAGGGRVDVLWIGKTGTFGMLCAFPMFLIGDGAGSLAHGIHDAAYWVLYPSLALSIAAAIAYVPVGRRALAESRAAAGERSASLVAQPAVRSDQTGAARTS